MEIVAIASALIFVKVLICYTLLQKCKTVQKIKKEIVKISEKMYKETENSSQNTIEMQTNQNKQNTKFVEVTVKKNPPKKPPRAFRPLHVKSMEKCDNSKNSSEETILGNNFKTFSNDDYIRSKSYNGGRYCDQCHQLSCEKEAKFQEIRHSNDVLYTSNEMQEQIPSSEIDIDSSKSIPQIPELTKILQLRFLVTNSSESRNSQFYSDEIIIKNNETTFMKLPKNMYKEKNIIYPLTSTKIQPKNTFFYKLHSSKMAIQWFNKTIVCGTTAVAALFYYVIVLRNCKKNNEVDKTDDNTAFEIRIVNPHSPNIYNRKQVVAKNSANPNNATLTSKVGQVISHFKTKCNENKVQSKQNASNGSVQPLRNKKLFSVELKMEKGYNSIILNSARFLTHDESNERIIPNNIALSCESNAQDNLNHSLIIRIGNLRNSTNNRIQIKIFNKPIKQSMLDMLRISVNNSFSNRSVNQTIINRNENQEIGIMISPLDNWHIVDSIITFYAN